MTTIDLPASQVPVAHLTGRTKVLCALFFFSGFPALIYQLAWQRALFRIFGINIESVTIVVAAFMLGLGLGSLAGGRLSRQTRIPLLPLLALIELATAGFGVISLSLFEWVGAVVVDWPLPAVAAVNLSLVIVPTLLMGATLPILVSHLAKRSGQVGGAVGLLYYVNTLGAGAACLVGAAVLFPFLGARGSVIAAVCLNIAVAIGALTAQAFEADQADPPASTQLRESTSVIDMKWVLALAALGGFISLSYEIFLFRAVSYASGSSATAFAITLAGFLVGIASGAREAGEACETLPRPEAMRKAVDDLIYANVAGLLFLPLMTQFAWIGRPVLGLAMVMVYLIARRWGSLLPYLAQFGISADGDIGSKTSYLYLANILGSAAGAIFTGFILTDYLGLVHLAVVLTVAGVSCTLLLIASLGMTSRDLVRRGAYAVGIAIVAVVAIPPLSQNVLENLQFKDGFAHHFSHVVENRSGIISVDADGTVYGNGMYDGRFNTDLKIPSNGPIRPYALSLFHPAPRDVLMIGLSSGSWAQIIASNPMVASLTVIEINPGYLELIAKDPEVASILSNPKIKIIADDGRRWLTHHPEQHFDAIVSNTTWFFRANISNLLSVEFLGLAKSHLKPRGILFYNTTNSDRVQRTACLEFRHGARFTNHMIVSDEPIAWDFDRWRGVLETYRIDGKTQFDRDSASDRAFLDGLIEKTRNDGETIEPCPQLLVRTNGKLAVTDDNMGSEWRYSLNLD